jgi:hypothetical protein
LDTDELTPEEIIALAEAFPVGSPSETLLRMAKFPGYAVPAAGYRTSLDFWSAVAEQIAAGIMPDGRRKLLAAARRKYPASTKFADPSADAAPEATSQVASSQGVQLGEHNVQFNFFADEAPREAAVASLFPRASLAVPGRTVPLRVLVIGASPSDPDLPYVRADREAHVIDEVARPDRIEIKYVLGAEATDIDKVRMFRPDILHFVCHGEDDCLVFNDTRGEADPVKASRIANLLRFYRGEYGLRLRAIVLAACDGNTLAPLFTGVANIVIGHRGKLADPCGEAFARQLYRLLNDTDDLAAAAREAAQLAAQFSAGCTPVIANLIVLPDGG